jgi:SAM-dependent methyltransferase
VDEYLRENRKLWDAWTHVNLASEMYNVEGFASGSSTRDLDPISLAGPGDVRGKSLLHLQCHFGMDTIRWARHGARVTGVDFSGEAIAAARALAARMNVPATFVESDVYALPQNLDARFDVVFTSQGVLGWLPDLERWAQVIAHFLAPGGVFHIVEAHPVLMTFDDHRADQELQLLYPYFQGPEPIREELQGSYAAPDSPVKTVQHVWIHPISTVIRSVLRAGLRLESFEEYPFMSWRFLPWMERGADGWWRMPGRETSLPQMFSLTARKPRAGTVAD